MTNGFNPMRWDCERRGCFNTQRRPKIEIFSDLFPGAINFGDVDAIVEINGYALVLEWKSDRNDPTRAQHIMWSRLTASSPITVMLVVGDAEIMAVEAVGNFFDGIYKTPESCNLDEMRDQIASWVKYAQTQPRPVRAARRAA